MITEGLHKLIVETYMQEQLQQNPTCYFYDLARIRSNIQRLQTTMPEQVRLYYAMKANPHDRIMDCVRNEAYTSGVEIASAGELEKALGYFGENQIIFTGPGKTTYELECAIRAGIRFINIESVVEAIRIDRIAERIGVDKVDILIRINLNYCCMDGAESMSGCSTKMGIDEDAYVESVRFISGLKHVRFRGIHVFAASGVLNYESLLKVDQYIFELVRSTEADTGSVDVIDFGGGLGIDYTPCDQEFDVARYGCELEQMLSKYGLQEKEIIMELGTYLVGDAGHYTAKIIDIKEIKGKKHIIIAGGVNHMGLPLEMQRKHPVEIIPTNEPKLYADQPGVHRELADISGPLCMVSDKLSWDDYIESAEIGDIVVYRQAGAYCYGEGMHEFLMDNCIGDLLTTISERSIAPRVSTGFSELDAILGGGIPAGLHVVAAMSSLGKTTLVVQMCASMAQQGQDILFFTLEMSRLELFAKNISRHSFELDIRNHAQTGFSTNDIVSGYPERSGNQVLKTHLQKSVEAYRTYADRLTVIEGSGDITAVRVRELTESYIRLSGRVPVVVIDYLQLLQPTDIRMTDKQNIDASIAELKRLTAQGCPVIAISSLNRASYDSPVTMASLKESGNIEYSSESILALDLQAMYDAQRQNAKGFDLNAEKQKPARAVLLTVLKNRNGRVGDQIPMLFYPKYNYFSA